MASELRSLFEVARKEYPGTKRGRGVEWDYLLSVCRKYRLDPKQTILEISAGVRRLNEWRNQAEAENTKGANNFIPHPKHFKTWLNNRCWTDEFPEIQHKKTRAEKLAEKRAEYESKQR